MEKQLIISVGREFGSGGHEVAQKLADDYGIALYDHDLLKEIAAKKNLKSEYEKNSIYVIACRIVLIGYGT